jgi:hypothetical protein
MTEGKGEWFEIPADLPTAYSVSTGYCGSCQHLHLILYDESGEPIAQCVLSDNMLRNLSAHYLARLANEDHRH